MASPTVLPKWLHLEYPDPRGLEATGPGKKSLQLKRLDAYKKYLNQCSEYTKESNDA